MHRPRTKLAALVDRIAFYEWAYGRLAESDSDIGPLGEFVVARQLGCALPPRKVNALYDLVTPAGVTIEVKTTTKRAASTRSAPYYRWGIAQQYEALQGRRPLAQRWIFLIATFPPDAAQNPRFDAFNVKWWQCYVATGEEVREIAGSQYVTEAGLKRLGRAAQPLAQLSATW